MRASIRAAFTILLSLIFSISSIVQFHYLNDSRLCNNGKTAHYHSAKCKLRMDFDRKTKVEYSCDTRNLLHDQCREVMLEVEVFSVFKLTELVPTIDSDLSLRRIVIRITNETTDTNAIGKEIDAFLTPRLWWYVQKETYDWNKHSRHIIVFDRVQHESESSLRLLAALQFPPSLEVCAKSPMLFNHRDFKHPGWYSQLHMYQLAHHELPFAITAMYVSSQNSIRYSASFITESDCPTTVNKWECAFLPLTNCSLPTLITNCTGVDCVLNSVPDTQHVSIVFDSASAMGNAVAAGSSEFKQTVARSQIPPLHNARFIFEQNAAGEFPNAQIRFIKSYNPELAPFHWEMGFDLNFYTYNLFLRPSFFYRSKIEEVIHKLRKSHNFPITERCVAAHIRRGDRTEK